MSTTGRRLLFAKLLHFTSCLANAAWGRYAGIYLNTQRHLIPLENGVVRGGGLLAKFLLTPMWGAWSDRGEPRQLLILSVSICALLFQFYFVDRTYSHFALLLVRTLTLLPTHPRKPLEMLGDLCGVLEGSGRI